MNSNPSMAEELAKL
jgi:serine/threonine protein kinase